MNFLPAKRRNRGSFFPSILGNDSFDGFMSNFFNDFNSIFQDDFNYRKEENGDVVYTLDVPGFNKDNLKVEVSGDELNISGESEVRKDNSYGRSKIFKSVYVGEIEDAEAIIKDGLLTVRLRYPKDETKNVKKIEIKDE